MTTSSESSGSRPSTTQPVEKESLTKRARGWLRNVLFFQSGELKEAIAEALDDAPPSADGLAKEEKTILKNLLRFAEQPVRGVMIPRSQIQAVATDVSLETLKKIVADKSHSRIPVFKDTLDNVKGFILAKDLFPVVIGDAVFDMTLLLRDVLFVPPSMKMLDLLVKMRLSRVHLAIVVDEFGGTDGLVTMEDLFEQIVGEIHDEHDEGEMKDGLRWSAAGTIEVDTKIEIDRLERELKITLRDDAEEHHYDTLGGLIFFLAGRVPNKGETIAYKNGLSFTILDGDVRRIKRVRIIKTSPPDIARDI